MCFIVPGPVSGPMLPDRKLESRLTDLRRLGRLERHPTRVRQRLTARERVSSFDLRHPVVARAGRSDGPGRRAEASPHRVIASGGRLRLSAAVMSADHFCSPGTRGCRTATGIKPPTSSVPTHRPGSMVDGAGFRSPDARSGRGERDVVPDSRVAPSAGSACSHHGGSPLIPAPGQDRCDLSSRPTPS